MNNKLKFLSLAAGFLLVPSAFAEDDAVQLAVKRLAESGSYEWKSDLQLPTGQKQAVVIEGRYNFSQGVHVKLNMGEKTLEVAARDGVIVASIGEEWKPANKFTRSDPIHTALRGLIDFALPHHTLETIVSKWRNVKEQDDGSFQGNADFKAANEVLATVLMQGSQSSGAKSASLRATVWLETGLPQKYLLEFSASKGGSILGGQGIKVNALTTLANIGSTTVMLPPEAEAALQAAKKP